MVALVTMKVGETLYSLLQTLRSRRKTKAVWQPKAPLRIISSHKAKIRVAIRYHRMMHDDHQDVL